MTTIRKTSWLVILAVCGGLLAMDSAPAAAQISYAIGGHARTPAGQPVSGLILKCQVSGETFPRSAVTGSDGFYSFGVPYWRGYTIYVFNASTFYSVTPEVYSGQATAPRLDRDFTVRPYPTIRGSVADAVGNGFALDGVAIVVNGSVVARTDAAGNYSFVAGRTPPLGVPMIPLTSTIYLSKSFHNFMPVTMTYDATSITDQNLPTVNMYLDDLVDPPFTTASWEAEDGDGWDYFPFCPAHDVPNNPNVHADLYFSPGYLGTTVSASRFRLTSDPPGMVPAGGVFAESDIGGDDGRQAVFNTPIVSCGTAELELAVAIDQADGSLRWYPVESKSSATSKLDISGSGAVDLSDVGILSAALGSRLGEPNFEPCVDYAPDGVINLSDIGFFASHMGHRADKSEDPWVRYDNPVKMLVVDAHRSRDGWDLELSMELGRPWSRAILELPDGDWDQADAVWSGDKAFRGEGVFATGASGSAGLVLLNDEDTGDGKLGLLQIRRRDLTRDEVALSVKTLFALPAEADPAPDFAATSTASATRLWAARPIGRPAQDPFTLSFALPQTARASLRVFDLKGRRVATLLSDRSLAAGQHSVTWQGVDAHGRVMPSGMYFALLKAGQDAVSLKLTILR